MKWRYGLIDDGKKLFVGELYFDVDPLRPRSWSSDPQALCYERDEGRDAALLELARILKDVLQFPVFKPHEIPPTEKEDDAE